MSVAAVLRRWVVVVLLFAVVCLTANGVAGLLGRLFAGGATIGQGTYGLALALAYALIGAPLAALLWWWLWRGLAGDDRHSIAWGLYLAAMYVTSLVLFTVNALTMIGDLIRGDWYGAEGATALTWLAVWLWHRHVLGHREKAPTRLATVPLVLGAAYGLGMVAISGGRALQVLVDAALDAGGPVFGSPWWLSLLQSLVWALAGAALWWWHWYRSGVRHDRSGFAAVVLVLSGVLAPAAAALGGAISLLHTALRALFDGPVPARDLLDHTALSLAAVAVGSLVWVYHRRAASDRGPQLRTATSLVESGLGLIALASGFGVIVNALLSSFVSPLVGRSATSLLLGGIAALVIGAAVWLWSWRPARVGERFGDAATRAYLVVVFAGAAVTALITLLVIAFRVFEIVLSSSGGAVDRIRAPLGLLIATALVAAYHFAVWRRDRQAVPASVAARGLSQIVLVASDTADAAASAVRDATGATVVLWPRTDAVPDPDPAAIVAALEGFDGPRALVIADPEVRVIPLAD